MKRIDKMFLDLQNLYAKRSALDTQIQGIEASLVAEMKAVSRPAATAAPAEKPAVKEKPAAKKTAAPPKTAKR